MNDRTHTAVQRALHGSLIDRARWGLGGSHTVVTYPPLDSLEDIREPKVIEESMLPAEDLHLYLHVAFCEYVCHFCAYAKTLAPIGDSRPEVLDYIAALRKEIDQRSHVISASNIASIYIGGGTPTVLSEHALMGLVEHLLAVTKSMPQHFCVETSPQTLASPDGVRKLIRLKSCGVTRISVGVQTFDDRLLRRYRGHGQDALLRSLDQILGLGLDVNLDLIQDLPDQSAQSIENDIIWLGRLRPHQVTWYTLRPEEEAPWHKLLVRGSLAGVPDAATSANRRVHINRAMRQLGYAARPGGRFLRDAASEDVFKSVRGRLEPTLLGMGASAYSHGWGWFFRNVTDHRIRNGIREYVHRMMTGSSPIWQGSPIDESERKAGARVVACRTVVHEQLVSGDDPDAQMARAVVNALADAGLMEKGDDGWSLTEAGRAFEEEVASLFYSGKVRERLLKVGKYWAAQPGSASAALLGLDRASKIGTDLNPIVAGGKVARRPAMSRTPHAAR